MSKINRSASQLNAKLNEQIKLLGKRCHDYDAGDESEALEIATRLRVLLHDTKRQASILKHLKIKNNLMLYSFAQPYFGRNVLPYSGLSEFTLNPKQGLEYTCPKVSNEYKLLLFDDWWSEVVIDDQQNCFSRENIVLNVADTDGGAHIDPSIGEDYAKVTQENSMGFLGKRPIDSTPKPPINNIMYQTVRMIARELICSLNFYNKYILGSRTLQETNIKRMKSQVYRLNDKTFYFCDIAEHYSQYFSIAGIDAQNGRLSGGIYENRFCVQRSGRTNISEPFRFSYYSKDEISGKA